MRGALLIAAKDLSRSLRDRSALMISVVAPLVLAFILSSVLPDESLDVRYGVVDLDRGPIAEAFVTQVLAGMERDGFADMERIDARADAVERAEAGDVAAAFVFASGFSDAVRAGGAAEIEVLVDPESELGAEIARSAADRFASELNSIQLAVATALPRGQAPDQEIGRLTQAATETALPVTLEERVAGSREFEDDTFFAAGMAVFFLFFTTQFGGVSLLRERREGTLARLLAAPVSRASIVAGKALFTFVLGVASLTVLIVATRFLLGANWGDPGGVSMIVLAAVFAAMGVQSLITTLAKTDEQASGYGSIIAVTLGLLGGTFFPLSQAPGLVSNLSFITPHAWIMRGLGDLSGGAGTIADVMPSIGALVAFGSITGAAALVRARRLMVAR